MIRGLIMSGAEYIVGRWLIHSALGGSLLLLLTWVAMRLTRQPARRQRLGEIGLTAALVVALLSLAPAWLVVFVPSPPAELQASAAPIPTEPTAEMPDENPMGFAPPPEAGAFPPRLSVASEEPVAVSSTPEIVLEFNLHQALWLAVLAVAYGVGAAFLLTRWLLGYFGLWRLLRTAHPAPPMVANLFTAMTAGRRQPRLLVARRLQVPLSCGLLRPTVVLPAGLCDTSEEELRWVFAHE